MSFKFVIEQIAIAPLNVQRAMALLRDLGADNWVSDLVVATGEVNDAKDTTNVARLAFNYQLARNDNVPLEFELLKYDAGDNWLENGRLDDPLPTVSHLGMHCKAADLVVVDRIMVRHGVRRVQDVETVSHTNPAIAGKRRYRYVIYGTRDILGVDLKFIVRLDIEQPGSE